MGRRVLVLVAATAVVGLIPATVFAKGEAMGGTGQVLIAGPGLSNPIELKGNLFGWENESMSGEKGSDFGLFVNDSPIMASPDSVGWFELAPKDLTALGPRYSVAYRFEYEDGTVDQTTQELYPYAPGGPLIHIPASVGLHDRHVELWWRTGSDVMLSLLVARGLPATAPKVEPPAPPQAQAPAQPPLSAPAGQLWIWVAAVGGLFLLVLGGVMAGRRRQVFGRA